MWCYRQKVWPIFFSAVIIAGCGSDNNIEGSSGVTVVLSPTDGVADAVIGIWTINGRVEVFFGGSDLTGTPGADISMAGASHEAFGIAVSGGASP